MHDLIKGQHVRRVRLLALLASSGLVLAPTLARADDFQGLGFLPGGSNSAALGVSADGTVVVGYSFTSGDNHAFRWSGGVMTDLGALAGSSGAAAYAASANGSVVVGSAGNAAGNDRAVIWTGGSITDLGTLGGSGGAALGVSSDGSVVVGYSFIGSVNFHAFRYSSGTMTDLGTLGGTNSQAEGVSGDGTVVIGESQITASSAFHAFRYSGGSMTDLGTLGGTSSNGHAVNADGTVVVGESTIAGNVATHAFRWSGGTMSDLGTLAGGTNSYAYGVSADGNVVVGRSLSSSVPSGEAFRWSQGTGMQSLQGLLVASGVNMTGWTLSSAQSVSADGTVIVGYGRQAGRQEAWLARCSPLCNGLITVSNVTQSFAGQSAMGQTGNAAIGGMLGTMNEYATQAKQSQGARNTPFSVFGYGAYDSDPAASGTLGMTVDLARDIIIGATVGANAIKTDMVFSGSAKMSGGNAGAFIARVPDAGLQWLAGIGGTTIKGDVTRGYLNGSGLASSSGSTTANGYGTTVRVGWTFDQVWRATQVTPFASYTYSMIHFNGYTETTGPFPAVFDGFNTTAQTSRLGADVRYTLAPGQWLWGTAAWAHRLDGAKSADITGTLIGLFGMTVPGASVARDWAELTAGVRWAAWKNGAVTASLTASVPEHQATTYLARIGLTQAF